MCTTISSLYLQNSVIAPRLETDRLFQMPQGSWHYSEKIDWSIRYIEKVQLLDADLWRLFVDQYRKTGADDPNSWRGEYWGKMMRGACFTYAYTQNETLYQTLTDTVRDMLTTQDSLGRFSTYSLDYEFHGWDIWCRKYILLGFQYFLEICRDEELNREILSAMCRHADYIIEKVGPAEEGKVPITQTSEFWLGLNASSILEPYVRLYNLTGHDKYLKFAKYIIVSGGIERGNIFELACKGHLYPYQYPVTKAYEMMSCFEGLIEYYRVTKEEKWLTAAKNFVRLVMQSDITVIGSAGCTHELFDNSAKMQTDAYKNQIIHMQETCVTVTWMKLCYQMLCLTGHPVYADAIERSAYNALLGAINIEGGHKSMVRHGHIQQKEFEKHHANIGSIFLPFDSYSPLLPNIRGKYVGGLKFMENGTYYGCCACIGSAGTGLLPLVSAMLRRDGVVLNLYAKGTIDTLTPNGQPLRLNIETDYPYDGRVKVTVHCTANEHFTVALRIPNWCRKATVTYADSACSVEPGYTEIKREWRDGDTIFLEMDMPVFTYTQDGYVAFQRGPIVLAQDARLSLNMEDPVDVYIRPDGTVTATIERTGPVRCELFCTVPTKEGESLRLIDYASAGSTWDETSKMAAWIPLKYN